jgi:hypothetical protein
MDSSRRRTLVVLAVAALVGIGAGIAIGLSEDDDPEPGAGSATTTGADRSQGPAGDAGTGKGQDDPPLPPPEDDPAGLEPGPTGRPPKGAEEEAAAAATRGYIEALDRRSGAAVCRSFVTGVLAGFEFPEPRASCAATVNASLSFAERGLPVWKSSEMTDEVSVDLSGDAAKVVATVFTLYADVPEPTIEDDIIHLARDGDRWLIAKPSLTLYRAVGVADPPPSALAPPAG